MRYILEGLHLSYRTGIYERIGDFETLKGVRLLKIQQLDNAWECFEKALHFYQGIDSLGSQVGSLLNMSEVLITRGDRKGAIELLAQAAKLSVSLGDPNLSQQVQMTLADASTV